MDSPSRPTNAAPPPATIPFSRDPIHRAAFDAGAASPRRARARHPPPGRRRGTCPGRRGVNATRPGRPAPRGASRRRPDRRGRRADRVGTGRARWSARRRAGATNGAIRSGIDVVADVHGFIVAGERTGPRSACRPVSRSECPSNLQSAGRSMCSVSAIVGSTSSTWTRRWSTAPVVCPGDFTKERGPEDLVAVRHVEPGRAVSMPVRAEGNAVVRRHHEHGVVEEALRRDPVDQRSDLAVDVAELQQRRCRTVSIPASSARTRSRWSSTAAARARCTPCRRAGTGTACAAAARAGTRDRGRTDRGSSRGSAPMGPRLRGMCSLPIELRHPPRVRSFPSVGRSSSVRCAAAEAAHWPLIDGNHWSARFGGRSWWSVTIAASSTSEPESRVTSVRSA